MSKVRMSMAILIVLALATVVPALAGDAGSEVKLSGFITDEWCGAKNANPDGVACAKSCAEKGSELAIFSDGKLYRLSDKQLALDHLGFKVVVTGTLQEDGSVKVASIEKAEKA